MAGTDLCNGLATVCMPAKAPIRAETGDMSGFYVRPSRPVAARARFA